MEAAGHPMHDERATPTPPPIPIAAALGVRGGRLVGRLAGALASAEGDPLLIAAARGRALAEVSTIPPTKRARCLALALVLSDLAVQGWPVGVTEGVGVYVRPPRPDADPEAEKARVRAQLHVERDRQLASPPVQAFVRRMEARRVFNGRFASVVDLMRDGEELALRLEGASEGVLEGAIQPYLQVIDDEERCVHTGLMLREIWRYFRHTWATPYRSTPGRSMMVLVRDAAAPWHPVIGIAALSSSAAQIAARDAWIGWSQDQVEATLTQEPSDDWARWLRRTMDEALSELYVQDLLEDGVLLPSHLRLATDEALEALRAEAALCRGSHQQFVEASTHKRAAGDPDPRPTAEGGARGLGDLFSGLEAAAAERDEATASERRDLRGVDSEGEAEELDAAAEPPGGWVERARTPLFRAKRAEQLCWLLRAKRTLDHLLPAPGRGEALSALMATADGRWAARQLARKAKADRMGTLLAEISVCGAVAPYSHLLGGKLVAMMVTSPELRAAYAARYGATASLIASGMAGRPIVRGAELALLMTTSLYGSGASQYNRLSVPCARVGGGEGSLRYERLGATRGFGTSHFSDEAIEALGALITKEAGGRQVNSIFGEGVNPRLRKVREGLDLLGLPSDVLLVHGSPRLIYAVPLARNTRAVLLGLDARPDCVFAQDQPVTRTRQLVAWWRERWLTGRVRRPEVLARVAAERLTFPLMHGARVPPVTRARAQGELLLGR
jgi:hypothetical protein